MKDKTNNEVVVKSTLKNPESTSYEDAKLKKPFDMTDEQWEVLTRHIKAESYNYPEITN